MPTILKTKNSVTTTVVPTTLQQGELAVNITDKKMWVGNAATTPVQIVGTGSGGGGAAGSNTQVQYNSSGALAGDADFTFNGTTVTMTNDASISGLTVGKGGGSVSSNTAVGANALNSNTTGSQNIAVGFAALQANTTGHSNIGIGRSAMVATTTGQSNIGIGGTYNANASLQANTTGSFNVAVGEGSLSANTTASNNTAVGYQAAYSNATGANSVMIGRQAGYSATNSAQNTFIGALAGYSSNATAGGNGYNTTVGYRAGYNLTTGYGNTFIGSNNGTGLGSGDLITTGNNHSILGAYDGNAFNLDIRTATVIRYSVISCGNGNRHLTSASGYSTALGDNAVPQAGTGITFPATQNGSSDANTLDDYEEGTWTPTVFIGATQVTSYHFQVGTYTKVGRIVHANCWVRVNVKGAATGSVSIQGLPFTLGSGNSFYTAGTVGYQDEMLSSSAPMYAYATANTTRVNLVYASATSSTDVSQANLNAGQLMIQISYAV
jgi:hypothetical protein